MKPFARINLSSVLSSVSSREGHGLPCAQRAHGADGSLTGYGGGLNNKMSLLMHEGVDVVGELCNTLRGLGSPRGASAADMV